MIKKKKKESRIALYIQQLIYRTPQIARGYLLSCV